MTLDNPTANSATNSASNISSSAITAPAAKTPQPPSTARAGTLDDLCLALNAHPRLQRASVCRLIADLDLWLGADAGDRRLAAALGVPSQQFHRAVGAVASASAIAARERRAAERRECRIITRFDDDYPSSLLDHALPPPVLYCRGQIPDAPAIAIVGARRMTSYGREAAQLFASGLARRGVCVVSGFAMGVDQCAHRAAVDARGTTVAVLGCGLDIDYPGRSRPLASKIAESGALISEFPLGCEPRAWHFPVRNRVIAALSAGVVVIQAKMRSGSLITAHLALELGRDVFAVPGSIFDEMSMGTNSLIADGAASVSAPEDVLEQLSFGFQQELFPLPKTPAPASKPRLEGLPGRVLDQLPSDGEPRTAEDLATAIEASIDRVLGALLELELGGRVSRQPGPTYGRL